MRLLLIAIALALVGCSGPASPSTKYAFEQRPCAPPVQVKIRCGIVRVPENYNRRDGRTLELNVVVLPALEAAQKHVAQFDLDGGPGFDATFAASFYLTDGAPYRRARDVVLVDQRGTGKSHPLRCPAIEAYDRQRPSQPIYPPALVKDCAAELSRDADLTQYTTANAARDLDAVRQALGYEEVSLNALSYGTTLALRYIADFGANVHSAVLNSIVPADQAPPTHHARAATRALSLVFVDCAADAVCAKAFPDLKGDFDKALARLDRDGGFARAIFLEKLRTLMYGPAGLRQVPFFIHQAAQGDFAAFDQATKPTDVRVFADGLYLSITCTETFARIDVGAAIADAAATPFGAYRLERQRAVCENWPRGAADSTLFDPVHSEVPALFISGAFDPVSPPDWAADTATRFPHARHIILPRAGHVVEGLSDLDTCFDKQVVAFVDAGTADVLDTSCFARMHGEPYRTE